MKKMALFLLCWGYLYSPLCAQNFIPSSVEAYRSQWPVQVQKMLDTYSAAIKLSAPEDIQTRLGDLQLDSTITLTIFDVGGGNTIATPFYRTDHTYPIVDTEVEVESTYEAGEGWMYLIKNTIKRDDLGRVLTNLSEVWDPSIGTWIPDSRIKAYPRGNDPVLLDSFYVEGYLNEGTGSWNRLLTVWNNYNAQEFLIQSLSFLNLGEAQVYLKDIYTYDANGNNNLIETFLVDGEEDIPAGLEELEYENNLLVLAISSSSDGLGNFIPESQVLYHYSAGKLDTARTFTYDLEIFNWLHVQSLYYEYDVEERLSMEETHLFYEEGVEELRRIVYEYVQDDYLASESRFTFDFNNNTFLWEDKKNYYYKELVSTVKPSPIAFKTLSLAPNPTTDVVRLNLENQAIIQVYNLQGQLVMRQSWGQGQEMLNLSGLPAGLYQLKVQAKDGVYAGKVVKQ